jgi:hypothetical protein
LVPLLLFLVVCLVAWIVLMADRGRPPTELTLVVRVRDSAALLEMVLGEAQRAGIGRLTIVDEGSSDDSAGIVALWARGRAGVEVCHALEADALGASVLVLDLRAPQSGQVAERTLRWLAGGLRP